MSLPRGFSLGPEGADVTKLTASSLIGIEGWPPAPLMEGCEDQADSSITLRAEPGQPRPNELGCDGAGEGEPGGASRNALHGPSSPPRGLQRCGGEEEVGMYSKIAMLIIFTTQLKQPATLRHRFPSAEQPHSYC